jgi:hypothetical protein
MRALVMSIRKVAAICRQVFLIRKNLYVENIGGKIVAHKILLSLKNSELNMLVKCAPPHGKSRTIQMAPI